MSTSSSGNCYIFTLMDYFTKWPEAIVIPNKRAETVAFELLKICMRMGFPTLYSSDQGREYEKPD
jgi:hypothetical protein